MLPAQTLNFSCNDALMKSKQKILKKEFMKKVPYTSQPFLSLLEDLQETFQYFSSKSIQSVHSSYDYLRCVNSKHLYDSLTYALMKLIARPITSRFPE